MRDDERGALGQVPRDLGDEGGGLLARLGRGLQHHHPLVGEQRRAQQLRQLVGADLTRAHPIDRDVVGACSLADVAQHFCHCAFDEQIFVTEEEVQLAHAPMVS